MKPNPAAYERTDRDGNRTLVVSGALSAPNAAELREQLGSLIVEAQRPGFVDLARVTVLEPHAVVELLAARNRAIRWNRPIVLVNPSRACTEILESTGLDQVFEIRS